MIHQKKPYPIADDDPPSHQTFISSWQCNMMRIMQIKTFLLLGKKIDER